MLNQNMNVWDRLGRIILGFVFLWMVLYYPMASVWLWILTFVGLIMIVTGISGYCPVYSLLKLNFNKK